MNENFHYQFSGKVCFDKQVVLFISRVYQNRERMRHLTKINVTQKSRGQQVKQVS